MKTMRMMVMGLAVLFMAVQLASAVGGAGGSVESRGSEGAGNSGGSGGAWLTGDRNNDKWVRDENGSTLSIDARATRFPQLVLSLAAVKRGPVSMTIKSDAIYVDVAVGYRYVRLELGSRKGEVTTHVVKMTTGGKPSISVDGKSEERWNRQWKREVENPKAKTMTLRFGRCESVKITWVQSRVGREEGGVAKSQAVSAGSEKPGGGKRGLLSVAALRKLADGSVLNLVIRRRKNAAASEATVTVLDLAGHGVAVLHELIGATKVEARRVGFAKAIPVQLIAVDEKHDLAMVKLDLSNPMARAVVRYIDVAANEAKVGDKVWALAPTGGTPAWARGKSGGNAIQAMEVVKVVASTAGLDRRTQQVLAHSPSTHWLEVDAVLDAAHSGGAVVNEQGQLVGISTWIWGMRRKSSPVESATYVKALLRDHAKDSPLGWRGLASMKRSVVMRYTTFPRLASVAAEGGTRGRGLTAVAGQGGGGPLRWVGLRKQVRLLEQNALCPVCRGTGLIYQRKQVAVNRGGGLMVPVYVDMPEVCPRCKGTGLNEAKILRPLLDHVVLAAVNVQPPARGDKDKQWVKTQNQLTKVLKKLFEEHYAGLRKLLGSKARALIKVGAGKIGQPVMVMGTLVRKVEMPGVRGGNVLGVRLGDKPAADAQRVVVSDAVYVGKANRRLALVMGVLAGWVMYSADAPPVAVVSRAWVLPLDQAKIDAAVKKQKDAITQAKRKIKDMERKIQQQQREQQRQQRQRNNRRARYY